MGRPKPPTGDILDLLRTWEPLVEFGPAASEDAIASAERRLGASFPEELRAFLLRADGATAGVALRSGQLVPNAASLVWSVAEIARNLDPDPRLARPRHVLFFADAGGDGILFGHPIRSPSQVGPDVVSWNPLDGELVSVAPSLRAWLEGWLTTSLSM
jgi:hypothetical protein